MGMQTRRLGRTDHQSSLAILGGAAFASTTPEKTAASFELALEAGVNHLDIAPGYGSAEVLVGPLIPAVRDRLFIGEKSSRANPDGVRAQLEHTLELFGTDHVDLYQAHGVTSLDELDRRAGAFDAILKARDEGLSRFVGITGHDRGTVRAQITAVERYDLDTVMFPLYPGILSDEQYAADVDELLALCERNDVGVQVIKSVAHQPWDGSDRTHTTWYEPWSTAERIERGIRFALSTPGVHGICTAGDLTLLPTVLDAVGRYTPMTADERAAALSDGATWPTIFPLQEHAPR